MADTPSFSTDILPVLRPFKDQMAWRFDLTDCAAVAANASIIWARIMPGSGDPMPPSPFPPLASSDVGAFKAWMDGGAPCS